MAHRVKYRGSCVNATPETLTPVSRLIRCRQLLANDRNPRRSQELIKRLHAATPERFIPVSSDEVAVYRVYKLLRMCAGIRLIQFAVLL